MTTEEKIRDRLTAIRHRLEENNLSTVAVIEVGILVKLLVNEMSFHKGASND